MDVSAPSGHLDGTRLEKVDALWDERMFSELHISQKNSEYNYWSLFLDGCQFLLLKYLNDDGGLRDRGVLHMSHACQAVGSSIAQPCHACKGAQRLGISGQSGERPSQALESCGWALLAEPSPVFQRELRKRKRKSKRKFQEEVRELFLMCNQQPSSLSAAEARKTAVAGMEERRCLRQSEGECLPRRSPTGTLNVTGVYFSIRGSASDILLAAIRTGLRLLQSGTSGELPENWTDTRETLLEGMLFNLKYLGMTLVEQPKGEELSAAAVKRIVATAKASGRKLRKITLKVSPRGIILSDSTTNELIENISIYRISYCTADKVHDKVFAYIAQSQHNENLECHAFLCGKRKMAQAVTLTVAQAFKVAFEFWQASKEGERVKSALSSLSAFLAVYLLSFLLILPGSKLYYFYLFNGWNTHTDCFSDSIPPPHSKTNRNSTKIGMLPLFCGILVGLKKA
ncbi:Low density lipoprotein receptor adapter protein 1 [Varanus komodoensis]|nr:Low density lipoprotein receptor adapter protein 1 [Varanus komodoensis]